MRAGTPAREEAKVEMEAQDALGAPNQSALSEVLGPPPGPELGVHGSRASTVRQRSGDTTLAHGEPESVMSTAREDGSPGGNGANLHPAPSMQAEAVSATSQLIHRGFGRTTTSPQVKLPSHAHSNRGLASRA